MIIEIRLPTIPRINSERLFDFRRTPIQINWNIPSDMKKIVAVTQPRPNIVCIITGANIIVREGEIRWSRLGTSRDAAPIRRTDLTETISLRS